MEALVPEPVRKPTHVAVAYKGIRHKVQGFEVVERIKGSRGNATDLRDSACHCEHVIFFKTNKILF